MSSSWRILRALADHLPLLRRVARLLHRARRAGSRCRRSAWSHTSPGTSAPSSAPRAAEVVGAAVDTSSTARRARAARTCPAPETDWYVDTTIRSMPRGPVQRRERGDAGSSSCSSGTTRCPSACRAGRPGSPRRPRAARRGPCGTRPSCRRPCAPRGRRLRRPLERERIVDVDDHEVEAVEAAGAQAPRRRPRRRRTAACGPRIAATRTRAARSTGNARSSRMRSISVPTMPGRADRRRRRHAAAH